MHFFLLWALAHHSFTFNSWFSYEHKHKVHPCKTVFWIFQFQFHFIFIKICFCSTKSMDSLTLKHNSFFQIWNIRKATHTFAPRPLISKSQEEALKFSDIYVSWSSPKTDLETNILNWKSNFENASFSE